MTEPGRDLDDELARLRLERDVLKQRLAEYETAMAARSTRWLYRFLRRARTQVASVRIVARRSVSSRLPTRLRDRRTGNDQEDDQPIVLTPSAEPTVSFVIPVHGKLELTRRCLASIGQADTDVGYEIIVIDDASPDDTWAFLERIEGVSALRNPDNQGYLRSVNRAAAQARGAYLFLLNNDTVIEDRCVDELVRSMHDPTTGAVGAKLLFPDGRLQEAGSFVWRDGTGHNFGHGRPDRSGDYEFVRDVDYASAAALLVRAELWRQLGGYDDRYSPAYYEDSDLAFGIRELGHRVRYQPRARVRHVAGASHGAGAGSESERLQERNRQRFADKWADTLAHHHPSRTVPYALPRVGQRHVMIIDEHVPVDDRDSGALRMWRLVTALAHAGLRVTFVATSRHPVEPATSVLRDRGIDVEDGVRTVAEAIEARAGELDMIVVSRPNVAARAIPAARRAAPTVPIAYDMVDFHGLRHERGAAVGGSRPSRHEQRMSRWENQALHEADHVIAITRNEADAVAGLRPEVGVTIIGNIHTIDPSPTSFGERDGVLFVGSWSHTPNQDAVHWLLDEVMPVVWKHRPDTILHLAGSGLPETLGAGEQRVVNHGWVSDLAPLFDRVRLSVAPLRFGAGLKGKVGDSLARGVPVVATPVAAEGFALDLPGFGDAETVAEFADAICLLASDQVAWSRARRAGFSAIEADLGPDHAVAGIESLIGELCP